MNKSPCSTREAVRRCCGELQPSLHWKGLLFIACASRIYWPRPRARPRGHGELLNLLRAHSNAMQISPISCLQRLSPGPAGELQKMSFSQSKVHGKIATYWFRANKVCRATWVRIFYGFEFSSIDNFAQALVSCALILLRAGHYLSNFKFISGNLVLTEF